MSPLLRCSFATYHRGTLGQLCHLAVPRGLVKHGQAMTKSLGYGTTQAWVYISTPLLVPLGKLIHFRFPMSKVGGGVVPS